MYYLSGDEGRDDEVMMIDGVEKIAKNNARDLNSLLTGIATTNGGGFGESTSECMHDNHAIMG